MRWDPVNKWLYIGRSFVLQFDNWHWISRYPTIRKWSLFDVQYDNGAWWSDLPRAEDVSVPHMAGDKIARTDFGVLDGDYPCYVQVIVFGVGLRYCFNKRLQVYNPKFQAGVTKNDVA